MAEVYKTTEYHPSTSFLSLDSLKTVTTMSQDFLIQEGRRQGSQVYVHEGRGYIRDKAGGDAPYLHCRNNLKQGCRGRAKLKDDLLHVTEEHSCATDEVQLEVLQGFAKMKKLVQTTSRAPRDIYDEVLVEMSPDAATFMPYANICGNLYKVRSLSNPPLPATLDEAVQFMKVRLYTICKYII